MIAIELPDLENALQELGGTPREAQWAIDRTVADVAVSGKAAATLFIFERYTFETTGPISRGIKTVALGDHAVIRFSGTRFPLKLFLPTRTDVGVEIMEVRGQRSRPLSHTFGALMQYGFGVFTRVPGAGRGPVRSMTGLSVANMAREREQILPEMDAHIREQYAKRLRFWLHEAMAGNKAKYERKGAK